MEQQYAQKAIDAVNLNVAAYCKFLSANDTGVTGSHQSGILLSKRAYSIAFDNPGEKGNNVDHWAEICWQDDFVTKSRFIYYGQGTRNEYRLTNFGRGFPFLTPDYTGALFVLVKRDVDFYNAYVLNTEDDIDAFLGAFGLTPEDTNKLIPKSYTSMENAETRAISSFISGLTVAFPTSEEIAEAARRIQNNVYDHIELVVEDPDLKLIQWIQTEFNLFKALEHRCYGAQIAAGFSTVDLFVALANEVLNRRKSRAGKSLEHHLAALFDFNELAYTAQAITEGNKRPDFIFPSEEAYHNADFPVEKLISLAAKTTCKDRWRQIINEADRLRNHPKYLCTLQQGISPAQLDEMAQEQVVLVVPKNNLTYFPSNKRDRILTLLDFIKMIKELQS